MSHKRRIDWLKQHGFDFITRSCEVPELGLCVWVDGVKGQRTISLWLSVGDGMAIIHGLNEPALLWEQLVDWIEDKQPERKKPLEKQRNLFE
jgi:hypothetical protein